MEKTTYKEKSMMMTEAEICRSYKESKNKREQVKILSQLNACDQEQIISILRSNRFNPPVSKKRKEAKTMIKSERDRLSESKFVEMTTKTKDEITKMPEIAVHFPNYAPPQPVWDLVEKRIEELNEMTETCKKIIENCTEEYGKLREFQVAYGVTGEKYHEDTDDSNRRGGNDGTRGDL